MHDCRRLRHRLVRRLDVLPVAGVARRLKASGTEDLSEALALLHQGLLGEDVAAVVVGRCVHAVTRVQAVALELLLLHVRVLILVGTSSVSVDHSLLDDCGRPPAAPAAAREQTPDGFGLRRPLRGGLGRRGRRRLTNTNLIS